MKLLADRGNPSYAILMIGSNSNSHGILPLFLNCDYKI